jgi:2-desacetyl-2-hydroxyethyl bacteriochlorophyllide A dehydrogenase
MRALVFENGQAVLRADYPDPSPRPDEALLRVLWAGICRTDLEIIKGYMSFRGVLGHEFVGRVVKGPLELQGKRVAAEINCVCGHCQMCRCGMAAHCTERTVLGIQGRDGVFADRVVVPQRNLHLVPEAVSDERAVFIEPLAAAFQVIRQVPVEPRTRVAVVGDGRLGLLVAQVLLAQGCRPVVIGRQPEKLLFCEKRGIQAYPTDEVVPRADYDLVVEASGSPSGLEMAMRLVRPRGTIVLKSTHATGAPLNLAPLVVNEITVVGSRCGPFADAIAALATGRVEVDAMISRRFPLDRALEALQAAHEPGAIKVLLQVAGD